MNSLVANYLVRLNVTTHVTASLMSRLPVPKPPAGSRLFDRLVVLAGALASAGVADDSSEYAELNAIAADLYGVSPEEYSAILDSFPLLPKSLRDRCLAVHVRATETQKHGAINQMLHEDLTDKILASRGRSSSGDWSGLAEQSYQAAMAIEMTDQD